ncbi:tryptophan-rich sensory protein [Mangrovibacillus cuniculi]|uniref:Tryptophan-rich sensory protein n=1 Tax=Mangrovibacillus cuniculi TaxID=2593652 RepID=A0A7S8C9G0_9BACI|nr:tryptophan-rich sensory protein [Mangrovibacillus cuniculi]QPC45731.1 tryptophan-rich sensory protein [Mangrovibacillus cuniculi]
MNKIKAGIIFVLLLLVIGYNGLANYLPLNGKSTGELSDAVPMYITPPGYVFSIWGFIYLITIAWSILLLLGRTEKPDLVDRTFTPFIAISAANILWLTFWHYQQVGISVLIMLFYLGSLIWMYVSIQSKPFRFWDRFPWSIHMGWISVATIVNISYWLNTRGFDGFGFSDATWTNALLFLATVLAIWIDKNFKDLSYTPVFTWAFTGIGFKAWGDENAIAIVAFGLAILLAGRALYLAYQRKKPI